MKQIFAITAALLLSFSANAEVPLSSDTRIKTIVYNENEVFRLVTHYGYQSNIEFARTEVIQTISLGDQVAWQVIPASRHLFIKALTRNAHTNMTVITDRRVYQFDLKAVADVSGNKSDMAYVIRFYYPEDEERKQEFQQAVAVAAPPAALSSMPLPVPPAPVMPPPQAMQAPMPMPTASSAPVQAVSSSSSNMAANEFEPPAFNQQQFNFNYTLAGDDSIAPVKVFDDGAKTYFQFAPTVKNPAIFAVAGDSQAPLNSALQGDFYIIDGVFSQFRVAADSESVDVFNEAMLAAR
jgi:type IV secretion system protein VirB9